MALMMKASKGQGGDFPKAPTGNHPAVLVAIVEIGTQFQNGFQGAPGKWQERAYFCWELVTEQDPTGKNFVIGADLTLSMNEKAKLRKWIETRMGKLFAEGAEYNVAEELGKPCLLNVVDKDGYPRIETPSSVPKGMTVPAPQRKPVLLTLADIKSKGVVCIPDWLPWLYGKPLAEHVKACKEFGGTAPNGQGGGGATAEGRAQAAKQDLIEPHQDSTWKYLDPDADDGLGAWVEGSASDVVEYATGKNLSFDKVRCTPLDVKDVRTAAEHGFGCGNHAPF